MKTPLIAALAIGFAGIALPAMAQSVPYCDSTTDVTANSDQIAQALRGEGYNVDTVDQWGGCARAFIVQSDGSELMMFFDPDTLMPVV